MERPGVGDCLSCGAVEGEECAPDCMSWALDAGAIADGGCPQCASPPGSPHDPGCPENPLGGPAMVDPDRYREGVVREDAGFDKFMDRIILQERGARTVAGKENNPSRLIAGKYQERPLGRIRYGVKR